MSQSERLFLAIGNVDDVLLARCEQTQNRSIHKNVWFKWGFAAACLCLVLAGAFGLYTHSGQTNGGSATQNGNRVIESYTSTPSNSSLYAPPENGTVLLMNGVQETISEHAGQNTLYFLGINFFADGAPLAADSDAVTAELNRLNKLGYQVGYATCWTYEGEGTQRDLRYTAGYFTEQQLLDFAASEQYGYSFHFVTNGDGSPVASDSGIDAPTEPDDPLQVPVP